MRLSSKFIILFIIILNIMNKNIIFVNREEELKMLEKAYSSKKS